MFAVDVDVWGAVVVCEVKLGSFEGGELGGGAAWEIAVFLLVVGHFVVGLDVCIAGQGLGMYI